MRSRRTKRTSCWTTRPRPRNKPCGGGLLGGAGPPWDPPQAGRRLRRTSVLPKAKPWFGAIQLSQTGWKQGPRNRPCLLRGGSERPAGGQADGLEDRHQARVRPRRRGARGRSGRPAGRRGRDRGISPAGAASWVGLALPGTRRRRDGACAAQGFCRGQNLGLGQFSCPKRDGNRVPAKRLRLLRDVRTRRGRCPHRPARRREKCPRKYPCASAWAAGR